MTVQARLIETHDLLIVSLHADERGDEFSLPEHPEDLTVLIGWGRGRFAEAEGAPLIAEAPALVLFSPGEITCTALTDSLIVYCRYDKNTAGSLDDVRAFVNP
jgi:hypothetical protein